MAPHGGCCTFRHSHRELSIISVLSTKDLDTIGGRSVLFPELSILRRGFREYREFYPRAPRDQELLARVPRVDEHSLELPILFQMVSKSLEILFQIVSRSLDTLG